MSIFVLAASSIPDVSGLRRLHRLPAELHDSEVAEFAFQRQRAGRGSELLPASLQRFVAFACVRLDPSGFVFGSHAGDDEAALLRGLVEASADAGRIVRWSELEAPLAGLRQRCLLAGQAMPSPHALLDTTRIDELGAWLGAAAVVPELAVLARLAGLPLEGGFDAERIWHRWLAGEHSAVLEDVERRALAVFLLELQRRRVDGRCGEQAYQDARSAVRNFLDQPAAPAHLAGFMHARA